MSNKVFEEAIADAKKLREVAEENAKKAILEAVTPKIREFIENELLEKSDPDHGKAEMEEEVEEGAADDEDVVLDEAALSKLSSLLGIEVLDELSESSAGVVSESTREAFSNLSDEQKAELLSLADKINESKRNLSNTEIDNKEKNLKENSQMSDKYYEVDLGALREAIEQELQENDKETIEESAEDGDDLESLLSELKLVLDLGEDIEEDQIPEELRGMVEEDDDDEGDEDVDLEDEAEEGDDAPEGDDEPEGEDPEAPMDFQGLDEDAVYEVDETMLAEELVRIRQMVNEAFGEKDSKAGVDGSFGGKGKSNAGVAGAFGGGKEGGDPFVSPPDLNKLAEAFRAERRKNRALGEKLKKYRGAVDTLREQLEDLNLFNAKLLYVNKLLQNKNLNESEKKSVIKALDEANSLREAKSLYKSLTETFTRGNAKTLTESRSRGSSSRPTTSSAPKGGAPELDRWQRLAGLK